MKMPNLLIVALIALVALPAVSSDAQAQDRYRAQVLALLEPVGEHLISEGFRAYHQPFTGSLASGATTDIEFVLYSGFMYVFVGACDVDCSDVDLILRDASGAVVASDTATDDVPVITFEPRAGTYTITVRMAACSAEPCRYGVAAFAR
jgi:hypothetical protein